MQRSQILVSPAVCVITLFLLTTMVHAQYRASIQGVVIDTQGAVIQGATVTLTDKQTNRTVTAASNASGIYNFNALPPSNYTVTAEKMPTLSVSIAEA